MRGRTPLSAALLLAASAACAQDAAPTLENGAIVYTTRTGARATIRVGIRCSDLWVSPDGAAITFIGVERERPGTPNEIGPFIERSSLYVALRADGFKPIRVAASPTIDRRVWNIPREPKLSPDLESVYFLVRNYMTSLQLTRTAIRTDSYERIGDVSDYCVVWGGAHSGDLILLVSEEVPPTQNGGGTVYPCYWRQHSGAQVELARECAASFEAVATRWSTVHGGDCR